MTQNRIPRIVATIEARISSTRLPGKVLMLAGGRPFLQILIERLQRVFRLDAIVIATTTNRADDPIAEVAHRLGVGVFRGSEDDVLGRVVGALQSARADVCVEITADCPLLDPKIVVETLAEYLSTRETNCYISNSDPYRSVPAGLDVQVFSADALAQLNSETSDPLDREHVSYGFYRPESGDRWKPRFIRHESCVGGEDILVTLDYKEDYEMIKHLYEDLSVHDPFFSATEIIAWVRRYPEEQNRCRQVRSKVANQ